MKQNNMKNLYVVIGVLGIIAFFIFTQVSSDVDSGGSSKESSRVNSEVSIIDVVDFETCVDAGYDVFTTSPRECVTPEGTTFYEIGTGGVVQGAESSGEAVEYCKGSGGTIKSILGDSGEEQFCVFSDGSMCEVGAYLRGDCGYGGY